MFYTFRVDVKRKLRTGIVLSVVTYTVSKGAIALFTLMEDNTECLLTC